jgi:two-component system chemotaxis response regulator CheB
MTALTRKIRVLIVDDSMVACRALAETVAADPSLEVAGTAVSGPIALAKLGQDLPDIVMLDVEMPGMDGLQTLGEIKKAWPKLPVIMCSGLTKLGNRVTMQALLSGASDYITKPTGGMREGGAGQNFSRELFAKIKSLCGASGGLPPGSALSSHGAPAHGSPAQGAAASGQQGAQGHFAAAHGASTGSDSWSAVADKGRIAPPDILVIGVSTGGPNALAEFLPRIPADFPVPIAIVQHMPPVFTKSLSASLTKKSAIPILEGTAGAVLEPGKAWLAPGGRHMELLRNLNRVEIIVHEGPAVHSCRPSVDVLFQSAAAAYGSRILALVMTGMGIDGLQGCEAIRKAGGAVFVQDEASSVVWGMPGAVAKAGLANRVLSLDRMADDVLACFAYRRKPRIPPIAPSGDA